MGYDYTTSYLNDNSNGDDTQMPIIDFGKLEIPIREIEHILNSYQQEEKHLILRQINSRFQRKIQEQQMKDNLSNIPLQGLVKRFMKNPGGDD